MEMLCKIQNESLRKMKNGLQLNVKEGYIRSTQMYIKLADRSLMKALSINVNRNLACHFGDKTAHIRRNR
jgi:hypothetical protein